MWQFKKIEVKEIPSRILIGKGIDTCWAADRTPELWRSFMPERRKIQHVSGSELFSIQLYPDNFNFLQPDVHRLFRKWAAVEVTQSEDLPGFEKLIVPDGLYAIFSYKGSSGNAVSAYQYIIHEWIPSHHYAIDQRHHFEILGEAYKNDHPDSEEDIYIPIRKI